MLSLYDMKRSFSLAILLTAAMVLSAQNALPTSQAGSETPGDTARAAAIIENYLDFVDFSKIRTDSVLCIVTYVIDREHPNDTMTIYRWYQSPNRIRIELWSNKKMNDAIYSDGKKLFRSFNAAQREWLSVTQDTYFDFTIPYDIRGALYDWRAKGAEASYAGEFTLEGHPVDRIQVSSPGLFDRYYFFERETGMLFMLTEQDHLFGDAKKTNNAQRVDWRAWHEFTPFHGCLMPSIESYQANGQVVLMYHHYHYEAPQPTLFTQDFRRQ